MSSCMTVGQLRAALEGVPDHLEVTVRAAEHDGNSICAPLWKAGIETECGDDEVQFLALDAEDTEWEEHDLGGEGEHY